MTPEIHRAALRAAARLALPAFIVACGSTPTNTNEETNAASASEEDLNADKRDIVDVYCNSMHPYETKEMCAADEVKDAHFPKQPHWGPGPDKRVDALTRGCCTVLAKAAEKEGTFSFPQRGDCCPAIGWDAAGSCTPWGPPVPPAMKRRAELAA